MLPTVDFCGLEVTRLILGANPFGGFSHQSKQRNEEMLAYHTKDRILETWRRAEAAGINTIVTNNESPHVLEAIREYFASGGTLQWIAQLACRTKGTMFHAVDEAAELGASALYFHGGYVDRLYSEGDEKSMRAWLDHARATGKPAGVAAHAPAPHLWVDGMGIADFHAVCWFNCGSLHDGRGDLFRLADVAPAVDCMRRIARPCIGYKILGAGRVDARMAFEHAFANIKPTDVVNVGMHRGDNDNMVEDNAALVREILSSA